MLCTQSQRVWQQINQTKSLNEQRLLQAEKNDFLHPSYVTGRINVSIGKCEGGMKAGSYCGGGGPRSLCSRQICTEHTMQDLVKAGHRPSGKATSWILLITFPGRISGATAACLNTISTPTDNILLDELTNMPPTQMLGRSIQDVVSRGSFGTMY